MSVVLAFDPPDKKEKKPECPVCGTKTDVHERIWIPLPWPFNKSARRQIDCPIILKSS